MDELEDTEKVQSFSKNRDLFQICYIQQAYVEY